MITLNKPRIETNINIASRVCERIQERFPYISPTKVARENYDTVLNDKDLQTKLRMKQLFIRQAREKREALTDSPVEFYKQLINDTDRIHALNCAEYVYLSYLGMRLNGLRTSANAVNPFSVQNKRVIDHVLLKYKNSSDKNSIFIDAWLGISGTSEKIKELYKTKFSKIFNFVPQEEIGFQNKTGLYLDDSDTEELRKFIPEMDLNIYG